MHKIAILLATSLALTGVAKAEETRRGLSAHEHGHGTLNMAVEGNRIAMELIVPGMDIVGFEHEAETPEQKAAVGTAEATLRRPLELFVLPAAAGCKVLEAHVHLESEDEHEEHAEKGHDHHHKHHAEAAHGDHHEESHTEFHVEYALECAAPDRLEGITFAYFERFAGAEELEVNVITDRGQTRFEVERDKPRLSLEGLIGPTS